MAAMGIRQAYKVPVDLTWLTHFHVQSILYYMTVGRGSAGTLKL